MIRVPHTQPTLPEGAPAMNGAVDMMDGSAPPLPAALPNGMSSPSNPDGVERQARQDNMAGIARDADGTLRNRADADTPAISHNISDAKIASKNAAIKMKNASIANLDALDALDAEDDGQGQATPLGQVQQEQVASLAQEALNDAEQAPDDEARAIIEHQSAELIADHEAAAHVSADRQRVAKMKRTQQQAIDTSISYAARLVDDPQGRAREMVELEEDIAEFGALEGWDETRIGEEQQKARAQVHKRIIEGFIATDPARARKWLEVEGAALGEQKDRLFGKVTVAIQAQATAQVVDDYLNTDDPLPTEQAFKAEVVKDSELSNHSTEVQAAINADLSAQYTSLVAARKKKTQERFAQTSDDIQAGKFDPQNFVQMEDRQKADLVLLHHENEVAARNGKARQTDKEMFGRLLGQGLRKFNDADLVADRSRLSEEDFQALTGLQKQFASASPRDKKLTQQYFANLSDLAGQADRHSIRMDILEAGFAEFMEEGGVPKFGRQTEILDDMAKSYRLNPLGSEPEKERLTANDLPMPGDSPEEMARKKAALDKRFEEMEGETRDPILHPAIETEYSLDVEFDQLTAAFGLEALAVTFGLAETELRTVLKADHQKAQDILGIWQGREGDVRYKADTNKLVAFSKLMGQKLGRDFTDGLKTNRAALEHFGQLVDRIENGGMDLSDKTRRELLERGQARLFSELLVHDELVQGLDKIGKYGSRGFAFLSMIQSFNEIVESGFDADTIIDESGSSVGGMIGSSVGGLLGGVCGPLALGCAIVFSGVGGAVGSYVGENARGWVEELMPALTGHDT